MTNNDNFQHRLNQGTTERIWSGDDEKVMLIR